MEITENAIFTPPNRSMNMKDAKGNNSVNPLLSALDRWMDNTVYLSASGGSTDYSSDESVAGSALSTVGRSMGLPSVQSSFDQSVQTSVEESIQQIYDTRELRKPKLSSRKLFNKNRPLSIRERLMQGEFRQQSEEGRKSPNEPASAKGIQVHNMNDSLCATGIPSAKTPKLWNRFKSKRRTKVEPEISMQGIPSYQPIKDDISVVTESVFPDLTSIPEAKAVARTDSAAESHASGVVETETLTKESSDLACNKKLQLSLPEKNMNPLAGDDDLVSTQGYEAFFTHSLQNSRSKLSAKLSFLPWVKSELADVKVVSTKSATDSLAREENARAAEGEIGIEAPGERDSNKVEKSNIPTNLPLSRNQKFDESQDLKWEEDKGKGERDNRKAGIFPRSFNPLKRSASKKSGKTATVCFSKDTKFNVLRSAWKGEPRTNAVSCGRSTAETCSLTCSTKLLDSQENECKGAPQKSSTQECSSPQTTVSASQGSNKMKDTSFKPAQLLAQSPPKCIPLIMQKSEPCSPDDKMKTKGRSLQRKEKSVRSAPAQQKRRMTGFLRKRLSQEVESPQTGQSASTSTESVPSATQATSSILPNIGDHQDKNAIVHREHKSKYNESHKSDNNIASIWCCACTTGRGNESTPKSMASSKIRASPTAEQEVSTGSPKAPAPTVSSPRNSSPAVKRLVASLKKSDKEIITARRGNLSPRKSLLDATTAVESKKAAKQKSPLAKKTAHYTAKINARGKNETKTHHPVLTKPPHLKQDANGFQEMILQMIKKKRLGSSAELRYRQSPLLDSSPENGSTPKSAARFTSGSRSSRKKGWTVSDEKRILQAMNNVQMRLKELEATGDDVHENETEEVRAQGQGCWMGSCF
jgi:hypothetical protein